MHTLHRFAEKFSPREGGGGEYEVRVLGMSNGNVKCLIVVCELSTLCSVLLEVYVCACFPIHAYMDFLATSSIMTKIQGPVALGVYLDLQNSSLASRTEGRLSYMQPISKERKGSRAQAEQRVL